MEISLRHSESIKFQVITEFLSGKIFRIEAAELLACSERTISRWARKVKLNGVCGVKNGNLGRAPSNKTPDFIKNQVLELIKEKYFDFNTSHLLEVLQEKHGFKLSYSTLHRWCSKERLIKNPRRGKKRVRKQRPRMRREGYILQFDGSHHKFNGEDVWCLLSAIDDATSEIAHARFFDGETTRNCLQFLNELVAKKGVPRAILGKRDHFSHFITACERLGIRVLFASSPEAKGRVERSFRTIQDRLIPELRMNNIVTMTEANFYLQKVFVPKYWNERNIVKPLDPESAYMPLDEGVCLEEICCFEYHRKIAKDQTISWRSKRWPVHSKLIRDLRGYNAHIRVLLDGEVQIYVMGNKIESEGLTKPIRVEPEIDLEEHRYHQALRSFYYNIVNKVSVAVHEHRVTGNPLNLDGIVQAYRDKKAGPRLVT